VEWGSGVEGARRRWRGLAGGRPARQGWCGEVMELQGAKGNRFRGLTGVEVERKVGTMERSSGGTNGVVVEVPGRV
jgi:hypothetical protein